MSDQPIIIILLLQCICFFIDTRALHLYMARTRWLHYSIRLREYPNINTICGTILRYVRCINYLRKSIHFSDISLTDFACLSNYFDTSECRTLSRRYYPPDTKPIPLTFPMLWIYHNSYINSTCHLGLMNFCAMSYRLLDEISVIGLEQASPCRYCHWNVEMSDKCSALVLPSAPCFRWSLGNSEIFVPFFSHLSVKLISFLYKSYNEIFPVDE